MELSQHLRPFALTKFSTVSWMQVKRRPLLVLLNVVNHTALLEQLTLLGEPEDDDDDSDAAVGKPELLTSALKKILVKWRLLLHHMRRCLGTHRRRHSSQRSPLFSPNLLFSLPL